MIKTRFAPSPTGYLHVGSLRTALYAYLFAKKHNGHFVLRIEDTDQNRLVEGAIEHLMETLDNFGLHWDEGPFQQSKRLDIYKKYADQLLESGHAYRCFCTPERLDEMRKAQQAKKQLPKYDRHCLKLSPEELQDQFNRGTPHVIRLKIPDESISFEDLIRGTVEFHGKDVDDQVLMKSDGFPTYHLAVVVDDHEMGITHVIRGEEWVPSTPKHLWLYQAFGWEAPEHAHLPLMLNPDKSKLSKRQGDVAAEDFLKKGYLKEALINFIAMQGWNPGTEEEFFTLAELIQNYSLDRVQKAGAVFSREKLDWYNGHYLREMPTEELAEKLLPLLQREAWFKQSKYAKLNAEALQEGSSQEANEFLKFTNCIQTRMKVLNDAPEMLRPFLMETLLYAPKQFTNEKMKVDKAAALLALEQVQKALQKHDDFSDENVLKEKVIEVIQSIGVKNGVVMWPLRIALTSAEYSPGAFELMQVMGKELSLKRLQDAIDSLT